MNVHRVYEILGGNFRRRRMALFTRLLAVRGDTSILDLGGSARTWDRHVAKRRVTVLNLDPRCLEGHSSTAVGDALAAPFPDHSFDLVFSNSVIEHLGTAHRQQVFASEVRRLSRDGYFVQTPNKWFPIEPHYLAPFVHWIPQRLRPAVVRWATPRGWLAKPSPESCRNMCREIHLLGARDMSRLFPEARIVRERVFGVTKSLIAVWRPGGQGTARW